MPSPKRILYLHGFASSPLSRKATVLGAQLRAQGFEVLVPDLEQNDFEHLTVAGQLQLASELLGDEPAILIGSSMGGYVAALLAASKPNVEKVVLLAPAFDFHRLWRDELGEQCIAIWKKTGALPVFHYGSGTERPLAYGLMAEAGQFPPFPNFQQPGLIFHGDRDKVVPAELSRQFAAGHPNTRIVVLPSGHELTDVLDRIWLELASFLEGP